MMFVSSGSRAFDGGHVSTRGIGGAGALADVGGASHHPKCLQMFIIWLTQCVVSSSLSPIPSRVRGIGDRDDEMTHCVD